jgi:hypothetical protein
MFLRRDIVFCVFKRREILNRGLMCNGRWIFGGGSGMEPPSVRACVAG